jgi:hypothetical protein
MTFFSNSEFTIAERIPKFNSFISRATDYLSIVGAERDGNDIACMADETACGFSGIKIPKTKSFIP